MKYEANRTALEFNLKHALDVLDCIDNPDCTVTIFKSNGHEIHMSKASPGARRPYQGYMKDAHGCPSDKIHFDLIVVPVGIKFIDDEFVSILTWDDFDLVIAKRTALL